MGKFILFVGAIAGAIWWFFFTPISEFKRIPSNFNAVFYMNMDSALKNQYVKKGFNDNSQLAKLPPEAKKMVGFIRKLMVDSIQEIYVAGNMNDKQKMIAFINFKEKVDMKSFLKDIEDEFETSIEPEKKSYKESEYFIIDDKGLCLSVNSERQFIFADESTMKKSLRLKKDGGSSLADNADLMKVSNNGRNKSSFWFAASDKKRSDAKAVMVNCEVQNYNMEMEVTLETNKMIAEQAEKIFDSGKMGMKDIVVMKDFKRKDTMITVSMKINISKLEKLQNFKF